MGIWYSVIGNVRCRDTPESRELLDRLLDRLGEDFNTDLDDSEDGIFTLDVDGGMHCSSGTACDIDNGLEALGPFAVEPTTFTTRCDDEEGCLWVGEPGAVAVAKRLALIAEAREALNLLTLEERTTLLAEYRSAKEDC